MDSNRFLKFVNTLFTSISSDLVIKCFFILNFTTFLSVKPKKCIFLLKFCAFYTSFNWKLQEVQFWDQFFSSTNFTLREFQYDLILWLDLTWGLNLLLAVTRKAFPDLCLYVLLSYASKIWQIPSETPCIY